MDEFERSYALLDEGEIETLVAVVESCDSDEAKEALEAVLTKND